MNLTFIKQGPAFVDDDEGTEWSYCMTDPISDTFAQQLHAMRTELLAQIRQQRGGPIGRAEAAADLREQQSGDWTQVDGERDLAMALDEREAEAMNAIEAALQRIAKGDYGMCTDCGIEIPTARLHANPTALRCVTCQDKAEHAHGGQAHPSL
jgi:DnaK suppressor protein